MTDLFASTPKGQPGNAKTAPGPVPELANKTCIHPGCKAYPCFGRKAGRETRWACPGHRSELGAQHES